MARYRQNDLLEAGSRWNQRQLFGSKRRSLWRGVVTLALWGVVTSATLYIAFFNV